MEIYSETGRKIRQRHVSEKLQFYVSYFHANIFIAEYPPPAVTTVAYQTQNVKYKQKVSVKK